MPPFQWKYVTSRLQFVWWKEFTKVGALVNHVLYTPCFSKKVTKECRFFIKFDDFLNPLLQENDALLEKGVDKMKVRTRQYARKQLKWINQRSV